MTHPFLQNLQYLTIRRIERSSHAWQRDNDRDRSSGEVRKPDKGLSELPLLCIEIDCFDRQKFIRTRTERPTAAQIYPPQPGFELEHPIRLSDGQRTLASR